MGPKDQNTGKSHRQQQHSHNTDVIFGPFTLHSTPILTRLPTISRPFQTTHHDHTRTTQGRYNGGPPGHQNTDNRHTAQSEPSRTTHGRYNMGPQGQKSQTTPTHTPTHCRSDVIPASFQSARKRRRWRRWRRRWRKSGTLLTPPGDGVNGTRICIILVSSRIERMLRGQEPAYRNLNQLPKYNYIVT